VGRRARRTQLPERCRWPGVYFLDFLLPWMTTVLVSFLAFLAPLRV
jgi:hypothetical protein